MERADRRPPLALLLPSAVAVGVAAFAFSCLFEAPRREVWAMGVDFAAMAADPFGGHGPFPHRVFGPLVAHVLGLHGDRYWVFAHASVVFFLALVFAAAVWRGCRAPGAAVLTFVVAVTGAVEVYKGSVGYSEPISYAFLLVSTLATRRTAWFWVLQFVGLTNHEGIVFFWPWLLWLKWRDAGLGRADIVGGALAAAAYVVVRQVLVHGANRPLQSFGFYWFDQQLSLATPGMWVLVCVSIVVYFGVLPALWAWHAWFDGWRRAGAGICLQLGAVLAMSCFAVDIQRFVGFLSLSVIVAGVRLVQQPRGEFVLAALGIVTAAAVVAQRGVVLFLIDTMLRHEPDPLSKMFTEIVPEVWPVFAGYALACAAMVVAGRWYALRRPPPG